MKKILVVLLSLLTVILCFTSCMQSSEAKAVQDMIDSIGEITLGTGSAIMEAEDAYTALSAKDKKTIFFKPLELARKYYDELKAFDEKAQETINTFNTALTEYGTPKSTITDSFKALSEALSSCSPEIRLECEKIFESVNVKYEEYKKIEAEAATSAKVYIDYFRGINTDKTITVTDIGCIAQISEGTVYYLFAFTYTDGANEKTVYSTVRFAGTPGKESFKAYEKNFYASAPSSETSNALVVGNIEILPGSVN